jgi:hypothetical protein
MLIKLMRILIKKIVERHKNTVEMHLIKFINIYYFESCTRMHVMKRSSF